jgi:uncharacterized protein YdgA (DUF945 family)
MKTLLAAAALLFALQPAIAQNKKVFRCEDASGRITYSDEACRGGKELANSDERSVEQRKAAADVAQREEKLADKMTRERVAVEKAARPAGAAHIPHSAADEAAKAQPTAKSAPKKRKKTVVAQKTQG